MIIDVLKAIEGKGYEFSFEVEASRDMYEGRLVKIASPLSVWGNYYVDKEVVFVEFSAKIDLEVKCDRCLKAFPYQNTAKGHAVFLKTAQEGEFSYVGYEIDLSIPVREALILAFPSAILCKEDCKGLCSVCGKDKNLYECSCEDKRKAAANPFAVLQNIGGKDDGTTKKKN